MSASSRSAGSIAALPTVLFLTSLATLVQAFVLVKLFFLGLFLLASIADAVIKKKIAVYPRLVWFYLAMAVAGIVWAIVGWRHPGNSDVGITDALRLYALWSVAFAVVYSLLRSRPSLMLIHKAMVVAGIVISVLNLVALADQSGGWGLIPDRMRQEMELNVGLHEGYTQITSNNIGALFLIVPYLLTLQFRADAGATNSIAAKLSLALSLIVVAVAGRRALWLVVALAPCLILLLSVAARNWNLLRTRVRRLAAAYTVAAALVLGLVLSGAASVFPERVLEFGYIRYLQVAFSAQDERTIQRSYLIDGFAESPILGSGFGAYAGYLRSDERPWTYELTYHQMLFNLGIVGVAFLGSVFAIYMIGVTRLLRRFKEASSIPFGLFVAFCSLLVGAYSNPYLRSFDLLFFVGLLPYLSTFRRGFGEASVALSTSARSPAT